MSTSRFLLLICTLFLITLPGVPESKTTLQLDGLVLGMSREDCNRIQKERGRLPHKVDKFGAQISYFEDHYIEGFNIGPTVIFGSDNMAKRISGGRLEFDGRLLKYGTSLEELTLLLGEPDAASSGTAGCSELLVLPTKKLWYFRSNLEVDINLGSQPQVASFTLGADESRQP